MKPRARRIALLTVAAGCLVVAGLVVFNWALVRDHAEAWWFVATRRTVRVSPLGFRDEGTTFQVLANRSGSLVIYDPDAVFVRTSLHGQWSLDKTLRTLRESGYRIIEQRFPRRAYVVTRYPLLPVVESPQRLHGGASTTLELKASPQ